ncbi:MAG: XTP/dITP diphosphatase [Erysipelotrichaceae bacterium]|nr:XTP/dITP diphosphatase [Erysipelotrichaceae bacterium]
MKQIMIATGNVNKVKEFKEMLEPMGYEVLCLKDIDKEVEIIENGTTFEENAAIKAKTVSDALGVVAIADDSGLEIDALNKEPGIHSARYLGHDTPYDYKNKVLLQRMEGKTDRTARFVCSIAIAVPNEETRVFTGVMEGEIAREIRGTNGFGYDPIFYIPECGCTSAELTPEQKNAVSHRGKATEKFLTFFEEYEKTH